jgi:hypothetical protein
VESTTRLRVRIGTEMSDSTKPEMTDDDRTDRDRAMADLYEHSGMTLEAIAKQFGLTRERVRQCIAALDPNLVRRTQALRNRTRVEERAAAEQLREESVPERQCKVCEKPYFDHRLSIKTCGDACAKVLRYVRHWIDPDYYTSHRLTVFRAMARKTDKPEAAKRARAALAEYERTGQVPPPVRRWARPDSKRWGMLVDALGEAGAMALLERRRRELAEEAGSSPRGRVMAG